MSFTRRDTLALGLGAAALTVLPFRASAAAEDAIAAFKKWEKKVIKTGLDCYDSFIKTLNSFQSQIANYFNNRSNSGFVEGLNNKIKVIKRRCYGILNEKHLYQRIYLDLEGYELFG